MGIQVQTKSVLMRSKMAKQRERFENIVSQQQQSTPNLSSQMP